MQTQQDNSLQQHSNSQSNTGDKFDRLKKGDHLHLEVQIQAAYFVYLPISMEKEAFQKYIAKTQRQ